MKKIFQKNYLFLFALIFTFAACNDPVFYTISQEVAPKEPRIKGAPSNFAVYDSAMYAAAGSRLHRYKKNADGRSVWDREKSPGGKIAQIASTGKTGNLYALCYSDSSSNLVLKQFDSESVSWKELGGKTGYDSIRYIYAAGNKLFIGAESSSSSFAVSYVDETAIDPQAAIKALKLVAEEDKIVTGEIIGAAFDGAEYYICTKDGIYRTADPSVGAEPIATSVSNFTGILSLEIGSPTSTIVVIRRSGNLHYLTETGISNSIATISSNSRFQSTGALAIWRDSKSEDDTPKLLLAGRQDMLEYTITSGYTYGYMELELDSNGIKADARFREPGQNSVSSITDGDNGRYKSTIGTRPVNHIFQAPKEIDANMTLFASTQKDGVWSYRQRSSGLQWNAEE